MVLAILIRCLVFALVQDVCVGEFIDSLTHGIKWVHEGDAQGQGDNYWAETRDTPGHTRLDLSETEDLSSQRFKRATNNVTDKTWPHDIPVVFSSKYKGNVDRVRRVMRHISDRLCVKFHDVTNTYDSKNPKWFTSNGFQTNSYVLVTQNSGCNANIGAGKTPGYRTVSPCNDFVLNLHEMFHVVGVIHEQKARGRESFISVQFGNIQTSRQKTYAERTDSNVLVNHFDPMTVMIYHDYTFSSNGLETFTYVRDDKVWYTIPLSHENNLFSELNSIYKCNEVFCNNSQTDCGPGYFALVYGECRCVCPDDRDPATNCQEYINQATTTVRWPKTPLTILGANGCPEGFNQTAGLLPVTGFSKATQGAVPILIPSTGNTLEIPTCSRAGPENPGDIDWLSWPPAGHYCIIKSKGVNCGGAFKEGSLELATAPGEGPAGDIGDSVVGESSVVLTFCCQKDDLSTLPIDLPNADPFRLIAYDSCPNVRGMAVTKGSLKIFTNATKAAGALPPKYTSTTSSMTLYQCLYTPPVYGCDRDITLDANNRSVRITTPGFDSHREPNRRCFFGFKNPKNSQLRLTFNSFDLNTNDQFLVKRYHPWQDAQRVKNDHYPHQIVSVSDYLSMEYWSSWETSTKKGLDFTVDVILEPDFCYNVTKKGQDYKGDKSVSETYEECLPWEKATSCKDFPFNDISLLTSGNKCRNPNGRLDQPWCYTYIAETECHKRYCDVCNIKTPVDMLASCSSFIQADPAFCTTAIERFGCSKTCGLSTQTYVAVVNDCPGGWSSYGGRCYKFFTTQLTYVEASETCRSFGSSGGLFQIRDSADQLMVVNLTDTVTPNNLQTTWISGQSNPLSKNWLFSDTNTTMTYLNMSTPNLNMSATPRQCLQINTTSNYRTGFWTPRSCDEGYSASYICQLDKRLLNVSSSVPCSDKDTALCESVMATLPTFCSNTKYAAASRSQCYKSCGKCEENTQCVESLSKTYHRTSQEWAVSVGEVMNFSCNEGLYHVGGDLQRACSSSGDLLGQEPVCSDHQEAKDIKLGTLRDRRSTITTKRAYLWDNESYRIPFDGNITKWYYYSENKGNIVFLVYRPRSNAYDYVGSNNITAVPNWRMTYNVPVADQISVKMGDVFGVYTLSSGTLSVSTCDTSSDKILMVPTATASSFNDIRKSNQTFPTPHCATPSLGLRLEV